jgi:hypothetical protein
VIRYGVQEALSELELARARLRVDKLMQQTHRLMLRIADKIGKQGKRQHGVACLARAKAEMEDGNLQQARLACNEAREVLVNASALAEHEGELMALQHALTQLESLAQSKAQILEKMDLCARALELVRVRGKRKNKLAEAKGAVQTAAELHQALLDIHPSTRATVVNEILAAGQELSSQLKGLQERVERESAWTDACLAGEATLDKALTAHEQNQSEAALEYASEALKLFPEEDAEEGKQAAQKLIQSLEQRLHHARAEECLVRGEEALGKDDIAGAREASERGREAADASQDISMMRRMDGFISRVEAREKVLNNIHEGHKLVEHARQDLHASNISAARANLAAAKSLLQVAEESKGLAYVAELERQIEEAECSRTSEEALEEAHRALQAADFAAARTAAAAASNALHKAGRSFQVLDALHAKIDAGEKASKTLTQAEEALRDARSIILDDQDRLKSYVSEALFAECKDRLEIAGLAADQFVESQTALSLLLSTSPSAAGDNEHEDGLETQAALSHRKVCQHTGLWALRETGWKDKFDARVSQLIALMTSLQNAEQLRMQGREQLDQAQSAFQQNDMQTALTCCAHATHFADRMIETAAQQVHESSSERVRGEGTELAADAESLSARVRASMACMDAVERAKDGLRIGEELLKEDKLVEANEKVSQARAAMSDISDKEILAQLVEQANLLDTAIARAHAAEEADAATSEVRDRIRMGDFEGARGAVMKASDALQRCDVDDYQNIILNMLSQVSAAEQVHRAHAQCEQLLVEAEAALGNGKEADARRALDAAHRAVEIVGQEALTEELRQRFAQLQEALGARDEAIRCMANASKAISGTEQMLASEQITEARRSLEAAAQAVDMAAQMAEGREDLREQLLELRAREAKVSEMLARGGNRAEARKMAAQHHAQAQRAVGAQDVATAMEELVRARKEYGAAGDLEAMADVLDVLEKQIEALKDRQACEQDRALADEAVKTFGEAVVQGNFELAESMLDKARAHYEAAKVDMSQVLSELESKMNKARSNAAKTSVADESLQLAIDEVAKGNLEEAVLALELAKEAYKAAGVDLMDDAIRELEQEIQHEMQQRERESAQTAAEAQASQGADLKAEHEHEHEQAVSEASDTSSSDSDASSMHASLRDTRGKRRRSKSSKEGGGMWRKAYDPDSGQVYYYHTETQETQWERPDGYMSEQDEDGDKRSLRSFVVCEQPSACARCHAHACNACARD